MKDSTKALIMWAIAMVIFLGIYLALFFSPMTMAVRVTAMLIYYIVLAIVGGFCTLRLIIIWATELAFFTHLKLKDRYTVETVEIESKRTKKGEETTVPNNNAQHNNAQPTNNDNIA